MLRVIIISLSFLWTIYSPAIAQAELIEGTFESGGHHFHFEGLSNLKYPFLRMTAEPLLLITHASYYWDHGHLTWPGIGVLVNYFRARDLPLKYLAAIEERSLTSDVALKLAQLYFPPGLGAEDIYPYQGDSHRIITLGQHVVIAGGNFTICACNTARSVMALSEGPEPLHIHYAMDAIYEGQMGIQLTLAELSDRLNDANFMAYLKDQYFNPEPKETDALQDTLPCRDPHLFALDRKFKYLIYRQGHRIGQFGQGETQLILHFESAAETVRQLEEH